MCSSVEGHRGGFCPRTGLFSQLEAALRDCSPLRRRGLSCCRAEAPGWRASPSTLWTAESQRPGQSPRRARHRQSLPRPPRPGSSSRAGLQASCLPLPGLESRFRSKSGYLRYSCESRIRSYLREVGRAAAGARAGPGGRPSRGGQSATPEAAAGRRLQAERPALLGRGSLCPAAPQDGLLGSDSLPPFDWGSRCPH